MICENLNVNELGHLTFAGADTVELAKKYGTPLYLLDEGRIRKNCREYVNAMHEFFGENSVPHYAGKALCFAGIYKIMNQEKMGVDVVSGGEIHTANLAGFPMEKACFHGNAKTLSEISYAMETGVGRFVADNFDELDRIDCVAEEKGVCQDILLRLTPGIDPHTFAAVNTGKVDSKFGTAIETGQAEQIVKYALGKKNINLLGFHCHIGSQIFDCKPFLDGAEVMLNFIADIKTKYGFEAKVLDLGGGFGVRYVESDPIIDIRENIKKIAAFVDEKCGVLGINKPQICMEPGRSIVADAGLTLYTVQTIKHITGFKSYIAVDGGMTDNPRYALYGSNYTVMIANRAADKGACRYTLAGRCCESGDLIGEDFMLPETKVGDIAAVCTTGAYNYSMASQYNRVPRPPIVMIAPDGSDYLAVRRETYSDIVAFDVL